MRVSLEMYDIRYYTIFNINVLHGERHVQVDSIQGRYGDIPH